MHVLLFFAMLGGASLSLADNTPSVDPDKPSEGTAEEQLLSATVHLVMEAVDFQNDVSGEASYKRSKIPTGQLVGSGNTLMQAITEGAECVRLRVMIKSVKHRYTVLQRGFESDHAIWKVARLGWSFNSLSDAYLVFTKVSGKYLTTRECFTHPRDRY